MSMLGGLFGLSNLGTYTIPHTHTLQIKAAEVQRKYSGIAAIYYRQQRSAALSFHTNCSGSLRSLQWKYLLCEVTSIPFSEKF